MKWYDRLSERDKKLLRWNLLLLALLPFMFWYSFGTSQGHNMRKVGRYIEAVQPLIDRRAEHDPAFQNLMLRTGTMGNGVLMVMGDVKTEDDRRRVFRFFRHNPPPRPMMKLVFLEGERELMDQDM
ncbi:hypothetical protein KQI84_08130 [bacterium]|nr:hypothetical protein [bacterium]